MNRSYFVVSLLGCFFWGAASFATLVDSVSKEQVEYERSQQTVVRNKIYYKKGHMEVGLFGSVFPYDSLVRHYMAGGRFTWHYSDHYGWEIADIHVLFPSVTGFTTGLVDSKNIGNLQAPELKLIATSNFVISPIYGKMRFLGDRMLYFDLYLVMGLGLSKVETVKVAKTAGTVGITTERSAMDPTVTLGFGIKLFYNRFMGLTVDFRDYLLFTKIYDASRIQSNFSVGLGLSFFLPPFA